MSELKKSFEYKKDTPQVCIRPGNKYSREMGKKPRREQYGKIIEKHNRKKELFD